MDKPKMSLRKKISIAGILGLGGCITAGVIGYNWVMGKLEDNSREEIKQAASSGLERALTGERNVFASDYLNKIPDFFDKVKKEDNEILGVMQEKNKTRVFYRVGDLRSGIFMREVAGEWKFSGEYFEDDLKMAGFVPWMPKNTFACAATSEMSDKSGRFLG